MHKRDEFEPRELTLGLGADIYIESGGVPRSFQNFRTFWRPIHSPHKVLSGPRIFPSCRVCVCSICWVRLESQFGRLGFEYREIKALSQIGMASYHYSQYPNPEGSSSGWDYDALKKLRKISPAVQNHLKRVYLSLTCALVASAVGVYLHLLMNIGGLLTGIACIGAIVYLLSIPPNQYNEGKRVKLLMAAAALKGATLGPLIDIVIDIDPMILATAIVGTGLAFACFSGAAIVARRREFLYLGGLLGSAVSVLLWLQFASALFGGSTAIYIFEIYLGLLVFLGYIVFDTQMIIERADHGESDYVKHSLELFTDFVAVFVRLLIILSKGAAENSEKQKKKRRAL